MGADLQPVEGAGLLLRLLVALLELISAYLLYQRYRVVPLRALALVFGLAGLGMLDFWGVLDQLLYLTTSWYASEFMINLVQLGRLVSTFLIALGVVLLGLATRRIES